MQGGNKGGGNQPRRNTAGKKNQQQQNNNNKANNTNNGAAQAQTQAKGGFQAPSKGKKGSNQAQAMQQEDEAIISASNSFGSQKQQPQQQQQNSARRSGNERALEKTSWVTGASGSGLDTLNDFANKLNDSNAAQPFNQFAGKKTNYSDNIYSTTLDMSSVSKGEQERAKRIEYEIQAQSTSNLHIQEDRGQVQEHCSDEEGEEEKKYGATDRQNRTVVSNQDGGVFKQMKASTNIQATKAKKGKFQTFHARIDKKAMKDMTNAFLKDLVQKKPTDVFIVRGAAPKASSTNLQPPTQQQPNLTPNAQVFQPTTTPAQMNPVKSSFMPTQVNKVNQQSTMNATANPFQANNPVTTAPAMPIQKPSMPFTPSQPSTARTDTAPLQPVQSNNTAQVTNPMKQMMEKVESNPFAAIQLAKEFKPGASFTPSAPNFQPSTQQQPQQQAQGQPFAGQQQPLPIGNAAPSFTPQSFQPPQQFYPSGANFNNSQPFQGQQQQQYGGGGYNKGGQPYYNNQGANFNPNMNRGPNNYGGQNMMPPYQQRNQNGGPGINANQYYQQKASQHQQQYQAPTYQNRNSNQGGHQMPMPKSSVAMPQSQNNQAAGPNAQKPVTIGQTSEAAMMPAGQNPFANLQQKPFEPTKKQ